MSEIDKKSEEEFNDWLDSIIFVNTEGIPLPPELTEDESDDPEGDREQ